jgi:alkylhydroperoxidase/carboxymuconolactone decarboxylase family protein YurZ
LSVAARCDPCIGLHAKDLFKLGATRHEVDQMLSVPTYMGSDFSRIYAACLL